MSLKIDVAGILLTFSLFGIKEKPLRMLASVRHLIDTSSIFKSISYCRGGSSLITGSMSIVSLNLDIQYHNVTQTPNEII